MRVHVQAKDLDSVEACYRPARQPGALGQNYGPKLEVSVQYCSDILSQYLICSVKKDEPSIMKLVNDNFLSGDRDSVNRAGKITSPSFHLIF